MVCGLHARFVDMLIALHGQHDISIIQLKREQKLDKVILIV